MTLLSPPLELPHSAVLYVARACARDTASVSCTGTQKLTYPATTHVTYVYLRDESESRSDMFVCGLQQCVVKTVTMLLSLPGC